MKDDAIQKDVSEEVEKQEKFKSERDEVIDAILSRRDDETEEVETDEEVLDEEEKDEEVDETLDDDQDDEPEQMVKIKVNGEEREVPLSQIVDAGKRTLQKESAADQKLDHASRLMKQVEELAKQVQQPSKDVAPPKPAQDAPNLKQIVAAIQYGTEEEAEKALSELIKVQGGTKQPTLTPEQVNQMVEVRLHNKSIQQKFTEPPDRGGFGDIAQDPVLYNMASEYINLKRIQGDQRMGWEIYEEAGKAVRQWRDDMVKRFAQPANMGDKAARKETISTVSGAAKKAASPPADKEKSPSEVIAEMAATRAGV